MIYLNPIGGLGNMFFQIASIWSLAKDNSDELCLLNINESINRLINSNNRKNAPVYTYIFNRFNCKNGHMGNVMHYPFEYVPLEYKREYEYVGYFQSEKYFKHRRNEIIELFKPAEEFNNEINKYSHLFNNISLHVRRGDYVGSPIHLTQTTEYYQNALNILPKDMLVLVFYDDLKWC